MNKLKKKDSVKDIMLLHSLAKVEFYGNYLERYLSILNQVNYINQINVYDVYCGMGIYNDGKKGSPIVAFDIIHDLYKKTHAKKVRLVVNDKDYSRISIVKNYIEEKNKHIQCCDLEYHTVDADIMLRNVINRVSKSPIQERNLVFIDPYGYKNINKEMIQSLMSNGKTEVILFLPISHMYRFSQYAIDKEDTPQFKPLCCFIKSFFSVEHPIVKDDDITVMDYISYVKEALSFNKYYTTSYHIERNSNSYFALFFLSSNLLGYEKILEAKWSLDQESGNGFNLPQQPSLFIEEEKEEKKMAMYEKLRSLLMLYITEQRTNIEIYEYTLKNEFLPRHSTQVLIELQNQNKITVQEYKIDIKARKGAFYLGYKYTKEAPKITIISK